jgi:hypothetical protein
VPRYVLIVDLFCLIAAVTGFMMAFRQSLVRRLIGRPASRASSTAVQNDAADPITYILRISGTMVMVFGLAIGGMVTLFNFL